MTPQEKICQFVIIARHPEAKSYKEVLEMETKFDNCLMEYKNNQYRILRYDNSLISFYSYDKNGIGGQGKNCIPREDCKILGRPITALDVCWALEKKYPHYYYFAHKNGIWSGYKLAGKCEGIVSLTLEFDTIKSDGTYTTLYDWSSEICENIARYFEND